MEAGQDESLRSRLLPRILIASGVLFLLAGAFTALFASVIAGIVLACVGITDLVVSVLLSRNIGGQPPAE